MTTFEPPAILSLWSPTCWPSPPGAAFSIAEPHRNGLLFVLPFTLRIRSARISGGFRYSGGLLVSCAVLLFLPTRCRHSGVALRGDVRYLR